MQLEVTSRVDAEQARREAHALAVALGFSVQGAAAVALAAVELATNLLRYARGGEIRISAIEGIRGKGMQLESHDAGPGIAEIDRALQDGYSTGGGLGGGLPAVRRLTDEFELHTGPGGTHVVARKWLGERPRF